MWISVEQSQINNDQFYESIMLDIQLTDARPRGQATSQAEAAENIMGQVWNVYGNQTRINVRTYAMIKNQRTG